MLGLALKHVLFLVLFRLLHESLPNGKLVAQKIIFLEVKWDKPSMQIDSLKMRLRDFALCKKTFLRIMEIGVEK